MFRSHVSVVVVLDTNLKRPNTIMMTLHANKIRGVSYRSFRMSEIRLIVARWRN